MKIFIISIFLEIFTSFLEASLIQKAQENDIISIKTINPRQYCTDKHKQIDDMMYGWGAGMLIKAEPIIQAVEEIIKTENLDKKDFSILFPSPSKTIFSQEIAHQESNQKALIFICGRYEGIDYRVEQYLNNKYPDNRKKISLGKFITLGGEAPTMVILEAIIRLIPWVINKAESRENESYNIMQDMENLEPPQYTRPQEVFWLQVPKILLSGDHKKIEERKKENTQ